MKIARRERREIAAKKREIMPAVVPGPNSKAWHPNRSIGALYRKEKTVHARLKLNRQRGRRHAA